MGINIALDFTVLTRLFPELYQTRNRTKTFGTIMPFALALLIFCYSSAFAFTPKFNLGLENNLSREIVKPSRFPVASLNISANSSDDEKVGEAVAKTMAKPMKETPYEYQGNLLFRMSPTHPKAFAITAQNFYWGENDESKASLIHLTFGRRRIDWSGLDSMWNLGNLEPLDAWDRLRPEEQGLTGMFLHAKVSEFDFRIFGSYFAVPETGPNVVLKDKQFQAEHPQAGTTTPESITLFNQPTPLGFELNLPPLSKILFRPSLLFSIETQKESAFRIKFGCGYLPLNYFPIAIIIDHPLDISKGNRILVPLAPRLLSHRVYFSELGYLFQDQYGIGIMGLIDQPVFESIPDSYTTSSLTTTRSVSPYFTFKSSLMKLTLSHLWTYGGLEGDIGNSSLIDPTGKTSIFSSRLFYRNATLISLQTQFGKLEVPHPSIQLKYIHEYTILADWIAIDFSYLFNEHLLAFVGGDLIQAMSDAAPSRGAEFLADVKTYDRIRMGVSYAF